MPNYDDHNEGPYFDRPNDELFPRPSASSKATTADTVLFAVVVVIFAGMGLWMLVAIIRGLLSGGTPG